MDELALVAPPAGPRVAAAAIVAEQRRSLDVARRDLTVTLERRRRELERALHDGAQQQLLALRMQILHVGDSSDRVDARSWDAAASVAGLVARLDGVLDDLGRLAAGERPRALDHGDLAETLREIAAISGPPPR